MSPQFQSDSKNLVIMSHNIRRATYNARKATNNNISAPDYTFDFDALCGIDYNPEENASELVDSNFSPESNEFDRPRNCRRNNQARSTSTSIKSHREKSKSSRPTVPYTIIITEAIAKSKYGRLTLNEIYSCIMAKYSYFKTAGNGWKVNIIISVFIEKQVSYVIATNPCFVYRTRLDTICHSTRGSIRLQDQVLKREKVHIGR